MISVGVLVGHSLTLVKHLLQISLIEKAPIKLELVMTLTTALYTKLAF